MRRSQESYGRMHAAAGLSSEVMRAEITDIDSVHRFHKMVYAQVEDNVTLAYLWSGRHDSLQSPKGQQLVRRASVDNN